MVRSPLAPVVTPDPIAAPWLSKAAFLLQQNRPSEAIALLQHSILIEPTQPWIWYGMAMLYGRLERWETVLSCIQKLIQLEPDALAIFNQPTGLALNPGDDSLPHLYAVSLYNQGVGLDKQNQTEAAIASYRQALDILPQFPQATANLSNALMRAEQLKEGLALQEVRWNDPDKCAIYAHILEKPTWDGSPIFGKTLYLFAEQGFGDSIQFARFVAIAAQRCDQIRLQAQPALVPLLQHLTDIPPYTPPAGQEGHFDYQASFMSLPHILGTDTVEAIPNQVPYIAVPDGPALPPPVKPHTEGKSPLKIGICWSCNPDHETFHTRSAPLEQFAAIAQDPNVQCYSVQKVVSEGDRQRLQELGIIDLGPNLETFATTAAYLNQCDRVITVDTSIAHLAGAIAKPVWIAIPFYSDWRWFRDRTDSPWYPTARLFRQPTAGDWSSTFQDIHQALQTQYTSQQP